jgi:anti-anti-sigma factor
MLEVKRREELGIVLLDLAGEIDGGDSCRRIHAAIKESLQTGHKKFVLNLRGVDWINSLGVGFLVAASMSAVREGAVVRLVEPTHRVRLVLEACGVIPHMWREFADERQALSSF